MKIDLHFSLSITIRESCLSIIESSNQLVLGDNYMVESATIKHYPKMVKSIVKLGHSLLTKRYLYSCYQYTVGGTQFRDRVIREALDEENPKTVLDLGCGPGPTLRVLPRDI